MCYSNSYAIGLKRPLLHDCSWSDMTGYDQSRLGLAYAKAWCGFFVDTNHGQSGLKKTTEAFRTRATGSETLQSSSGRNLLQMISCFRSVCSELMNSEKKLLPAWRQSNTKYAAAGLVAHSRKQATFRSLAN